MSFRGKKKDLHPVMWRYSIHLLWYLALHGQWNTCTSKKMKEREFLDSHFPEEEVRGENNRLVGKYLASWLADSRRKKCTKIESEKKKPTKITTIIALEIVSQDLVDH